MRTFHPLRFKIEPSSLLAAMGILRDKIDQVANYTYFALFSATSASCCDTLAQLPALKMALITTHGVSSRRSSQLPKITPNLHTSVEDYSGAEKAKLATDGLRNISQDIRSPLNLSYQFKDTTIEDLAEAAEILAKSYGIYLEFNRAKTGTQKDWMYMVRVSIPGGGPIQPAQWKILDDLSDKYTETDSYTGRIEASLRLTSRQNVQFHWIKKRHLADLVLEIAKSGFYTLNGCGDNVRNVMGCPLSHYSRLFDSNARAQDIGAYFRLPSAAYIEVFEIDPTFVRVDDNITESESGCGGSRFQYGPVLLNRKFKIGVSSLYFDEKTRKYVPDNCVELRTNDVGIAPVLDGAKVSKFQIFIGGGQGEKAGHSTFAALGVPFGLISESDLLPVLDAVVKVHQEWGDRKNRHWARLKYVIYKMGIEWYRDRVRELGISFEAPIENFDCGPRLMHHGWTKQENSVDLWSYGAFIENGRIIDGPNGNLKKMIRFIVENYAVELLTTPNQDLIFGNVPEGDRKHLEQDLSSFGFGLRNGRVYSQLRKLSGACVGRDTCRLTYTDSEKFEPYLIDLLEPRWGNLAESIGITGCEKQCFRPATKTIGWVGSGLNMYALKIGGTEDGRNQGGLLIDPVTQEIYLKNVPRKDVALITSALFEFYTSQRLSDEQSSGSMGYFFQRVGPRAIIEWLNKNPETAALMEKTIKNPLASEKNSELTNPSLLDPPGTPKIISEML
jgi:sulfite reductase beta subunit-like hemoprotein